MDRFFFSYSRADKDFVLRLAKDLRSADVKLWIDQLDIVPGDRWDRAVEEALEAAPGLLVVLSPDSVNSQNVMDEVSLAFDVKKRIVPILIRQCDIPFRLRRLQYVDFTITTGYEAGLAELIGALKGQRSVDAQAAREKAAGPSGAAPIFLQGSPTSGASSFQGSSSVASHTSGSKPTSRGFFSPALALLGLILVLAAAGLAFLPKLLNQTPSHVQPQPPTQNGTESGPKRTASYFTGSWTNTDSGTRGITRLNIRADGPNLFVKAWGKCHPTDCEWIEVPATAYGQGVSAPSTADIRTIEAVFKTNFNESTMTIRPEEPDGLKVDVLTHFTDNSGRANYSASYQFRRGS